MKGTIDFLMSKTCSGLQRGFWLPIHLGFQRVRMGTFSSRFWSISTIFHIPWFTLLKQQPRLVCVCLLCTKRNFLDFVFKVIILFWKVCKTVDSISYIYWPTYGLMLKIGRRVMYDRALGLKNSGLIQKYKKNKDVNKQK